MKQEFARRVETPRDYLYAAAQYRSERCYDEARRELENGVRLFPESALLHHQLGRSYRAAFRDLAAMECFETAHRLAPRDVFITMDLAKFKTTKGQFDEAETLYLSLLADRPGDHKLFCAIGHMYQASNRPNFAAVCFAEASALAPADEYAPRRYQEIVENYGATANPASRQRFIDYVVDRFAADDSKAAAPAPSAAPVSSRAVRLG